MHTEHLKCFSKEV